LQGDRPRSGPMTSTHSKSAILPLTLREEDADLALRKSFTLAKERLIIIGAEAFNLLNHANFAVPSNTQNPFAQGCIGDAVFKDHAANFAENPGHIFTTVSNARQIQLAARLIF
jgi:hypothetical protein